MIVEQRYRRPQIRERPFEPRGGRDFRDDMTWRILDPNPGRSVDEIPCLSSKAVSLLARVCDRPLLQAHVLSIRGAIEMLEGLEYHHAHMIGLSSLYRAGGPRVQTEYNHEVNAYLARLGQLYYFLRDGAGKLCGIDTARDTPLVVKFLPLRHKHAAHRSVDMPKGDSEIVSRSLLVAMSGGISRLRPDSKARALAKDATFADIEFTQRESLPVYQVLQSDGPGYVDLCPEIDHAAIADEIFRAIAKIVATLAAAEVCGHP